MEKLKASNSAYRVLRVEADYAVSFTVDEQTKDYMWFEIPPSNWSLAVWSLEDGEKLQPAPMRSISIFPEESSFPTQEIDFALWWRCAFVSNQMKEIFDRYGVEAYYSDAELALNNRESSQPLSLILPLIAIDAIDRDNSIYTSNEENSIAIRINKIEKLVLDPESFQGSFPPLFVLAGTSHTIWLVRSDLADSLESAKLTGVLIQNIEDCSWDY